MRILGFGQRKERDSVASGKDIGNANRKTGQNR